MDSGKGLYIEGCDFGAYNSSSDLYQRFGCAYLNDGWPSTIGNVSSLTGQSGTFVQGYNYDYLFQQDPDNFVDEITANGGTIIYASQDAVGRAIMYDGPGNNYRALHSTFIFGALQSGTNTKEELMQVYMNYLLGN